MNFSPTKPGRVVYLIFEIPCHFIFIPETLYTSLINPPREKPYLSHSPSVENVETKSAASLHGVEEELGTRKREGSRIQERRRMEGLVGFALLTGYRDV